MAHAIFLATGLLSCWGFLPRVFIILEFCLRRLTSVTCHAYYNYLVLSNAHERSFLVSSFLNIVIAYFSKGCQVKSEYYYTNHQPVTEQDENELVST